jgi:hypothetical protein
MGKIHKRLGIKAQKIWEMKYFYGFNMFKCYDSTFWRKGTRQDPPPEDLK